MKHLLSAVLAAVIALSLTACGGSGSSGSSGSQTSGSPAQGKGEIRYLNFKPEIAGIYDEIAKAYEDETGVKVRVDTAASGTYEQTLKSEIAKSDAPVIFQINGPKGYAAWKDYCADLKDTELYAHLSDQSLAITDGGGVYGIPYVVEGYGIIYNNAIMEKYFATEGAKAASMDEITGFDALKAVVEDMTSKKAKLGIEGVFASTSLAPGDDWRWQTHLANIPIYYEFKNNNVDLTGDATGEITFQYSDNYKNIFDLYLNNSVTAPGLLGSKSTDDSMAEFALGKVAMVQNGNWAWSQISGVSGNVVAEDDIRFLPIYTGVDGEESQGLCTGTENFFAINKKATEEQQKLAEDFLFWLFSSETGKDFVVNRLNFIAPFDTFEETEKPSDPLAREVTRWMDKDGVTSVAWNFTVFPNQAFKDKFGAALLEYAQGGKTWEAVKDEVVTQWKAESEKQSGAAA